MFSMIISLACLASCGGDSGAPIASRQPALPAASPVSLPSPDLSGLPAASPLVFPAGAAMLSKSEHGVRRDRDGRLVWRSDIQGIGHLDERFPPHVLWSAIDRA